MRARSLATRSVAITAAVAVVLAVDVRPASAQVGWGLQDDSAITAGATDPGSSPATAQVSRRRRGVAMCTAADGTVGRVGYEPVAAELLIDEQKAQIAEGGGGIYWKTCGGQSQLKYSGSGNGGIYIPPRTRDGPPANPGDLAEEALERTPLPEPVIEMAPPPEFTQLVNLPVFLWLGSESWKTFTATATAGPVTSTVTATPKRVIWDMGTGDTVVCDGPGLPYDPALSDEANPSTCRYTYRRSSAGQRDQAFVVTATVEWETTWTVSGAAGGGGLGTAARSSSTKVTVAELQALNIYDRP